MLLAGMTGWVSIGASPDVAHAPTSANGPAAEDRAAFLRRVRDLERTLNAVRARHFGGMRVTDVRKEGMLRFRDALAEFADPLPGEAISVAMDVVLREALDVRLSLLRFICEQGTEPADTTLAWTSCFDRDLEIREIALGMVVARAEIAGVPHGSKLALDRALRSGNGEHAEASARVIEALRLLEAIPLLISAQVATQGAASADPNGVRAFIMVGQQQTFVSGLTPVVGNSTVAFQPEMSTLTTGTLLVVGDSLVTSYRTEVHASLVRLTSEAWGRSTAYLGWDLDGWRRWHREVFTPFLAERAKASLLGPAPEPDGG